MLNQSVAYDVGAGANPAQPLSWTADHLYATCCTHPQRCHAPKPDLMVLEEMQCYRGTSSTIP